MVLVLLLQAVAAAVVVSALPFPAEVTVLARPDRLFATSANQGIVEIDPADGAVLNVFPAPENQGVSDGLAFDGTTLYYLSGSWDANTLYALDPDSGTVIDSYTLPPSGFRNGLAAMDGKVYILEHSVLAQDVRIFDPATGTTVGILDIDGTNPNAPLIGGGLAAIHAPDGLLVSTNEPSGPHEILEIDAGSGEITGRCEHGRGPGVLGVAVIRGEIYLGLNTDDTLTVYGRDGSLRRPVTAPGSVGFQSLGGDDARLPIDVDKQVSPPGTVNRGHLLTYTVHISTAPGSQLGLYDPLAGTVFVDFLPPVPAGIVHVDGVVTGTVTVTPSSQLTLTFVVEVSAGATVSVTNRACTYARPGNLHG